jgi:hypothetical protein
MHVCLLYVILVRFRGFRLRNFGFSNSGFLKIIDLLCDLLKILPIGMILIVKVNRTFRS